MNKSKQQNKQKQANKPAKREPRVAEPSVVRRNDMPALRDYRRPSVFMRSDKPKRKGASVRIIGCDYVGPVSSVMGTAADNVFVIQASLATTFPRLSAIADVFELYNFNKLSFHCVGIPGFDQPGAYTQSIDYESAGSAFTATQIRNQEGQVTEKFPNNSVVEANCDRAVAPWFTTDGVGSTAPFGDYHLLTDATTTAIPAVDLFVCYDCEFAQGQAVGTPELRAILHPFLRKEGAAEWLTNHLHNLGIRGEPSRQPPPVDPLVQSLQAAEASASAKLPTDRKSVV